MNFNRLPATPMATCTSLAFWFQFLFQSWWHFRPFACLRLCRGTIRHSDRRHTFRIVRTRWKLWCLEGNWVERTRDHSLLFDMFAKFPIVKLQRQRKTNRKKLLIYQSQEWIKDKVFDFTFRKASAYTIPDPFHQSMMSKICYKFSS